MKQFIKKIILFIGYILNYNKKSKVIYYHDIGMRFTNMGTSWDLFKKHMDLVCESGYSIVDNISKRDRQIQVCFDDGWAGIYDVRHEIIEMNIHPTIFIAVDLIGTDGFLTKEQILEMQAMGFIFECHTWSHQDLTLLPDAVLNKEIVESKCEISKLLKKEVDSICFPKGRYSDRIVDISKNAGYKKIYLSLHGSYYKLEKEALICRLLCQSLNEKDFKYIINGESSFYFNRTIEKHKML